MRSAIHEMRNQLAVAVANIEAIIDGKLAPTPMRLGAVLHALNKLDVLMNDVQHVATKAATPMRLRNVDICKLMLNETIAIEGAVQAAGISLDVRRCTTVHAPCACFRCDPVQVSQVVKNILLNAIKYSGPGGRISLDCHREPGVLVLEISDDGPGVTAAERDTIFDLGVRGSASGGTPGSGVGLSVVRTILEAHGGTVDVDDSTIGGARFVIRLPGNSTGSKTCRKCVDHSSLLHESITAQA